MHVYEEAGKGGRGIREGLAGGSVIKITRVAQGALLQKRLIGQSVIKTVDRVIISVNRMWLT